jgi:hypothetical protein
MAKRAKESVNVFAKATEVAKTATPTTKAGAGSFVVAGLKKLAALDTVIRALSTIRDTSEAEVKQAAVGEAVARGMKAGKQPENFELRDVDATAGFQLKKRNSRSTVKEEEAAILDSFGISTEEIVDRPEMFGVNSKYAQDQATLEKVSKFLVKAGLDDFIVMQTKVARCVTTETSIAEVFQKIKNVDDVRQLLPLVSSLALKIKDIETREAFKIALATVEESTK